LPQASDRLIIALDDESFDTALKLVNTTKLYASTFKVGLSLFCAHGPKIVEAIRALGVDVFLDLKLCDIPMQVEKTIKALNGLSPRFLTVHAWGGEAMLKAALLAANESDVRILVVSVLTSLEDQDYRALGFSCSASEGVLNLSKLAFNVGAKNFVSSGLEVRALKQMLGQECFVVCPGVRGAFDQSQDQRRFVSAKQAIMAGADAIVVGRPITRSRDVCEAARLINLEIECAMKQEIPEATYSL